MSSLASRNGAPPATDPTARARLDRLTERPTRANATVGLAALLPPRVASRTFLLTSSTTGAMAASINNPGWTGQQHLDLATSRAAVNGFDRAEEVMFGALPIEPGLNDGDYHYAADGTEIRIDCLQPLQERCPITGDVNALVAGKQSFATMVLVAPRTWRLLVLPMTTSEKRTAFLIANRFHHSVRCTGIDKGLLSCDPNESHRYLPLKLA